MILLSGNTTFDNTANLNAVADGVGTLFVPFILVVVFLLMVGALLHAYQGLRGYKRLRRVMNAIGRFFALAFLGIPLAAGLVLAGYSVWYVATADAGTQAVVWRWVWRAALTSVVLAGAGWVTERFLDRFNEHKAALEEDDEGDDGDDEDQEEGGEEE